MEEGRELILKRLKQLTFKQRLIHFRGKVRRWWLIHFRPGYVKKALARRRGECTRLGTCCHLGYRCFFLKHDENACAMCSIYEKRPQNCRIFPLDERDLRERDFLMPDHPCGYYFVDDENSCRECQEKD